MRLARAAGARVDRCGAEAVGNAAEEDVERAEQLMSAAEADTPAPTTRTLLGSLGEEAGVWLFVFKTLVAYYLAGWLAMRFSLPQPSTAMLTTIIVANRQSGMV